MQQNVYGNKAEKTLNDLVIHSCMSQKTSKIIESHLFITINKLY